VDALKSRVRLTSIVHATPSDIVDFVCQGQGRVYLGNVDGKHGRGRSQLLADSIAGPGLMRQSSELRLLQ